MEQSNVDAASRAAVFNDGKVVESGPPDSPLFEPEDPSNQNTLNFHSESTGYQASNDEMEPASSVLSSSPPAASSQPTNHSSHTRYRQDGTTPMAEHHAITTGTSWIDETILRMKEAGYSTKEIAEYLRKESNGEVDYDPKTIGTRYTRINKLLEEQAEQRIDDELTDWHEGEDEELLEVEAQVRVEIRQEMAKLKAKRWELVAHKLQSKLKKGIAYSAGSCQKRYVALQNDTATIPIELDDNPEQRLIQRQQKSIRLVEQIHKAEFAKEEAKNKKKLEKDQRELAYKQRKEEHSRKRHEKAVLESKKAADRLAKLEAQKAVTEKRQREEAERIAELQNNLATGISTRPDPLTPGQKRKANALNGGPSTESAFAKSTALPRGKMTLAELSALCQIRKVSKTGSKVQLQQRLQKEAEKATRAELRSRLSLYAADTEGTKEELVDRLAQADEANSDWAQNNGSSKRPRKRARTSNLSKPIVESSSDDVTVLAAGEKTKNASTLRKSTVDNSKATVAEDSSSEEHKTSDDETEANEELANGMDGVKTGQSATATATATAIPTTVQTSTATEPAPTTSSAPEPATTTSFAQTPTQADHLTAAAQRMRSATPRETRDMFEALGMEQNDLALLALGHILDPENEDFRDDEEHIDVHELNLS